MEWRPTRRQIIEGIGSVVASSEIIIETQRSVGAQSSGEPTADFSYSPQSPNPDETVTFDGSESSDSDGEITDYRWEVDGSYEPGDQIMEHSFDTGGTYSVTLEVTDNDDNTASTTKQVTVENPAPTAAFTYSPNVPSPDETVTFDASDSSDPDGEIVDYRWEVDGSYEPGDQIMEHSFDTAGTYSVMLEVTDNGERTDSVTETAEIENTAPTAAFTYSPNVPSPDETVTFDASDSSDPDGKITDYRWEVDGSYEPGDQIMEHSFDTEGTYSVSLEVTDNGEQTDTITKQVEVGNTAPTGDFTYSPDAPSPDETVTFDASPSSDPDGEITDYRWEVDGSYQSGNQIMEHSFDTAGTYSVSLEVSDNGEKTDSVMKTIEVDNTAPTADFSHSPQPPVPGEAVTFDASLSSDPDGEITEYRWEVEGSYESGDVTMEHTFDADGTYSVTLEVTDNGEKTDSVIKEIPVGNTAPDAEMSLSTETLEVGESITFDATASTDRENNIESYLWTIDGELKSGAEVTHTFSSRGEHTVELTVEDTRGETNTARETFFVGNRAPSPSISYSPTTTITTETTVTFTASDSTDPDGSIESYQWTFPDEKTKSGESVDHTFSEPGEQTVTLAVSDDGGETATESVTVSVDRPETPTPTPTSTPTPAPTATTTPSGSTDSSTGTSTSQSSASPTSTKTLTTTETEESAAGTESEDDMSVLPVAVGLLGLGGAGAWWLSQRDSDSGEPVEETSGEQFVERGDTARESGAYDEAITAYEEALETYQRAKDQTDSRKQRAAFTGAIAETREKLAAVRERKSQLDTVREPLMDAESSFQTAITEHAQNDGIPARRDYRQARDQYERALSALDESEADIFEAEGDITVQVSIEADYLPNKLVGWESLTGRERDALGDAGLGTLTDIRNADAEMREGLLEKDPIDEELVDRLRAASWWHGEETRTFTSRAAIERQRDRAEDGFQMLS